MRRVLAESDSSRIVAARGIARWLGGYLYLRRSLPQIDGTVAVAGLSAPVEIIRDADAIPHIFAATKPTRCSASATCTRRIGCGRWSSSGGSATAGCRRSSARRRVPQDRFLRTVGFGRAAQSGVGRDARLGAAADRRVRRRRQRVHRDASRQRAAAGVHAAALRARAVDRRRRPRLGEDDGVGPERELFARAAAPRPRCARSARSGWRSCCRRIRDDGLEHPGGRRRQRCRLATAAADGQLGEASRLPARPARRCRPRVLVRTRSRERCPAATPPCATSCSAARRPKALGSNNWVVDGTLTASGKPLLANDPHLGTQAAVDLVSRAHVGRRLRGDRRDAARARRRSRSAATASSPGARPTSPPTSRISIASGSTRRGTLRRVPRRAGAAARSSRKRSASRAREPVQLDVRVTRHGPLVSDAINANNAASTASRSRAPLEPLAFRWTALDADDRRSRRSCS